MGKRRRRRWEGGTDVVGKEASRGLDCLSKTGLTGESVPATAGRRKGAIENQIILRQQDVRGSAPGPKQAGRRMAAWRLQPITRSQFARQLERRVAASPFSSTDGAALPRLEQRAFRSLAQGPQRAPQSNRQAGSAPWLCGLWLAQPAEPQLWR